MAFLSFKLFLFIDKQQDNKIIDMSNKIYTKIKRIHNKNNNKKLMNQ